MRPIEFRAWVNINIDPFMTYEINDIDFDEMNVFCDGSLKFGFPDEAILMQFTGLLDKNGKKIFEGDIVNVFHKPSEQRKPIYPRSTIVYEDGCFWIKPTKENWGWLSLRNRPLEIIGNIYKNPDLLKETP